MKYTSSTRLLLLSPTGKICEISTKYRSTQDSWNDDGRRTLPALQLGASEHPQWSRVTRDEAGAGWMMTPVLDILFRQLRRRPSVQAPVQGWCRARSPLSPSRPKDSRVEYREGGPPAQVNWHLNTGSLTNRPPPVLTTWPGMQKGASRIGHQERSNRAALL